MKLFVFVLGAMLAACENASTGDTGPDDAGTREDATAESDAFVPSTDSLVSSPDTFAPGSDTFVPDTFVPSSDTHAEDADAVVSAPSSCSLGPPLSLPIAKCAPAPLPSTGDPHEDCVRRINQIRCECQHLPPLERWVEGEKCADEMAHYDYDHGIHAGFGLGICDPGGYAQCECPGWPTVSSTISACLQGMWNEGPHPGPTHYEQMASTKWKRVACGFYSGPPPATPPLFGGPVFAVQNYE